MLQKYIKETLANMVISEEQKMAFLGMLQNIKTNEAFLEAFLSEFQAIEYIDIIEEQDALSETMNTNYENKTFFSGVDFISETSFPTSDGKTFLDETLFTQTIDLMSEGTISKEVYDAQTFMVDIEDNAQTFMVDFDGYENDIGLKIGQSISRGLEDPEHTVQSGLAAALRSPSGESSDRNTILASTERSFLSEPSLEPKLGRYLDLGVLGKGGMGEVRKVKDQVLNRNLAMKIIHPQILQNKRALAHFIEEAQVGAQLQHPNIVPIHELGTLPDGRYYFTMKEIKGRELTELIHGVHEASTEKVWRTVSDGTSFRRLLQIFHTICETMAFAHSNGVIHRDLKPENVMIGGFGEVLVVDWGIAKVLGQVFEKPEVFIQTERSEENLMATRMGMVAGTPAYMSPEQANGDVERINIQSDIYTLGAILYEILSGKPPYTGRTALDIVEKVKASKPEPLLPSLAGRMNTVSEDMVLEDSDIGKIPLPLIQICEKAMERKIEDRYASAQELAEDIFDWLEGAQKKERALKEFESAVEMLNSAIEKEILYKDCWTEANQYIQKHNFEDPESWLQWGKASIALKEAQELRQDYRRGVEGAFVYDLALEEANEALAELVLEDIIIALAKGEREQREILEKRFNKHILYLSKRRQAELSFQLDERKQDHIQVLRARRGVLVGREAQRIEIAAVLREQSRLVSLVGTAGVGKTRLALEVIHDLQEPETKTYFCNLTEANSALGIALFVAKAMNVKLRNVDPIGQLGELFAEQSTILVLDNLEQVVESVGTVITRWMEQSESLRIMTTSRIKLHLSQEYSFSIQPLSLLEGMELFSKRGQQSDGQFSLNEENRRTIGRLVQRLDNLPLAIELAAARLNIFSVDEVEIRLKERFSLLRSRSKGIQALQGALDWSWDLLKPWAKVALSQTSVFRGGFDVSAAEMVLDSGYWKESPPIFDILQDLSDSSLLLQSKSSEGNIRYGTLESIRQYSREKLLDNKALGEEFSGGKASQDAELRHSEYYSQFGQKSYLDALDNQGNQQKLGSFFDELDNFIAGTEYGAGKPVSLCCLAAMKILGMKGPISLGVNVVEATLEKRNISGRQRKQLAILRTRFLRISGRMNEARGERKERTTLNEKVEEVFIFKNKETETSELSEAEKNKFRIEADDLLKKGSLEETAASYNEAMGHYNQAYQIYQRIRESKGVANSLLLIAIVFQNQGNYEHALLKLEDALNISEKNDLLSLKADIYVVLGAIYSLEFNHKKALEAYQNAFNINKKLENHLLETQILGGIGHVYLLLAQFSEAQKYFQKSLKMALEIEDKRMEARNLGHIGIVCQKLGQYDESIKYYKKSIKMTQCTKDKRNEGQTLGNLATVYKKNGEYGEALICFQKSIEIAREVGNKRNEGHSLGNVGEVYFQQNRLAEAKEVLIQAIEILESISPPESGIFLGVLAFLYTIEGNLEKAFEALERGEPLIAILPMEYGEFLCKKAQVYYLAMQPEKANQALGQAEEIAITINATEESELGVELAETREFVSQNPSYRKAPVFEDAKSEELSFDEREDLRVEADELLERGNLEEAESFYKDALEYYNKAYKIYEKIGELKGQVEISQLIAVIFQKQGEYESALLRLGESLELAEKHGLTSLKAKIYSSLGDGYRLESKYKQALTLYENALEIDRTLNNRFEEGLHHGNLGTVYFDLGQLEEAIVCFQKSLEIAREIGNKRSEGINLAELGNIHSYLDRYEQSILLYQFSLAIAREIGDKQREGLLLGNLGTVYDNLGEYDAAIISSEKALEIVREIGDKRGEGLHLGNLGTVYFKLLRYEDSIGSFKKSIKISQEVGAKRNEGIYLGNLAEVFVKLERLEEAKDALLRAIEICDIAMPPASGTFRGTLALLYAREGAFEEAFEELEKGAVFVVAMPSEHGKFLCKKAKVYYLTDQFEKANKALKEAEDITEKINTGENSELRRNITETKAFISVNVTIPKSGLSEEASAQGLSFDEKESLIVEADELLEKGDLEESEEFYEEALEYYEEAYNIYQRIDYHKGVIETLQLIGRVFQYQGEYEQSLFKLEKGLEIAEAHGFRAMKAKLYASFGHGYHLQYKYEDSLEFYQKSLAINQRLENRYEEGKIRGYLGVVYQEAGKNEDAILCFLESLKIAQEFGAKRVEGNMLEHLGNVYSSLGQSKEAAVYYQKVLEISREMGDKRREGKTLGTLGIVHRNLGEPDEAIFYYQASLDISREIEDKRSEGRHLGNIGVSYAGLAKYDEAIVCFQKSIKIAQECGDKITEGTNIGSLGKIFFDLNRLEEAKAALLQSIEICEVSVPPAAGTFRGILGVLYATEGAFQKAFAELEKGEPLIAEMPSEYGEFLCKKATVMHLAGRSKNAEQALEQAENIAIAISVEEYSALEKAIRETKKFLLW